MSKRRFKGLAYPITKHPQGFLRNADNDIAEIKASLATIILTKPGERIFEITFGFDVDSVKLNAPKEMVIGDFRMKIASAIKRWEKRVQVKDINIDVQDTNGQIVLIVVVYFIDPVDINVVHDLTVYKSLGGKNGRAMPF